MSKEDLLKLMPPERDSGGCQCVRVEDIVYESCGCVVDDYNKARQEIAEALADKVCLKPSRERLVKLLDEKIEDGLDDFLDSGCCPKFLNNLADAILKELEGK